MAYLWRGMQWLLQQVAWVSICQRIAIGDLSFNLDYLLNENVFVGSSFTYNNLYYKSPNRTINDFKKEGLIVTGKEIRLVDVMPISFYGGYFQKTK